MSEAQPRFSNSPKIIVASVERRGSYDTIGTSMKELKDWLGSKGIEQADHPFCMFYDNPTETPEGELRSEACIPVSRPFASERKFRLKVLQRVEVAETSHVGPPEQFAMTYGPFLVSLIKNGYGILGSAREYYDSVSDVKGPGAGYLIQQPISKK